MLKRDKLAKAIEVLADRIFQDSLIDSSFGQKIWKDTINDSSFLAFIKNLKEFVGIPSWQGDITQMYAIDSDLDEYSVLAVDGSQIYPDRHISGVSCFLINAGGCFLSYGDKSNVTLFSEPVLFLPEQVLPLFSDISFSLDLVDLKREEFEFETAFRKSLQLKSEGKPFLSLFDGSLIFWHLESKQQSVKDIFLRTYLYYLKRFYEKLIPIAGYISMPKSKELVGLVKLKLCKAKQDEFTTCHGKYEKCPCVQANRLVDLHLLSNMLKPYYRTTIFINRSKIAESYPSYLRPCFFYLNVGKEHVRIEIPAWIAHNSELIETICKICINQSEKGYGYPVCLAEAHEQAVVKGPDRDFFYHLIRRAGIAQSRQVFASQKSIKKRGIGI